MQFRIHHSLSEFKIALAPLFSTAAAAGAVAGFRRVETWSMTWEYWPSPRFQAWRYKELLPRHSVTVGTLPWPPGS